MQGGGAMSRQLGIYAICGIIMLLISCGKSKQKAPVEEETVDPLAEKIARKKAEEARREEERRIAMDIQKRLARFAPTKIDYDDKIVWDDLRPVLRKLIEAAQYMDEIFMVQVDPRNIEWRKKLSADPAMKNQLRLFDIMFGPWDRLDENKPFVFGVQKPPGANFYPTDMSKDEFQRYIKAFPEEEESFTSYFTVIRRKSDKTLEAVPYSDVYEMYLTPAAKLLKEAAALSNDRNLKKYLNARADAFKSNEYRESDMAWMDLGKSDIEIVIGPYEVYEDALMGLKAAFEAFVCIRDPEDSKKLARIVKYIPELEKNLPMPRELNKPRTGSESPISVAVLLFSAGDTKAGVQTLAFNLPNDEVVREKKGSKKVMLRNVAHAKFDQILIPIAKKMMIEEQMKNVTFEAFMNHTLMHETAHGIGPGMITLEDGTETEVSKALQDLYPTIEEAKADVLGLWSTNYLINKKVYPESFRHEVFSTFLGGFFRSVRFGAHEAHGQANAIQFNYLMAKKAVELTEEGVYKINYEEVPVAIEELARDLLLIEAKGDYEGAKKFIKQYGELPKQLTEKLASLTDIPVDIVPEYTILEKMKSW